MSKKPWSTEDMPSMSGKLVMVTGATAGLGYESAKVLASKGAIVILTGRNEEKGKTCLEKILKEFPSAKVSFGKMDFASFASVRKYAEEFNAKNLVLDILLNNAGVSNAEREVTEDGHELGFQTNHLSSFALTALLLPSLRRSKDPRVVTVSSGLAKRGEMKFQDLMYENTKYDQWQVYSQTKLANLLFMNELQRKSDEFNWGILAVSVHPGYTRTDMTTGEKERNAPWSFIKLAQTLIQPFLMQEVADGAKPQLFASSMPEVDKGGFYGPTGLLECKGPIGKSAQPEKALNQEDAKKLWEVSCELTNVTWPEN